MKKLTGKVKISPLPTMKFPDIGPSIPQVSVKSLPDILQSIKKEVGTPIVTYDEAIALTNIKFDNGEPLLRLENRYFVYEVVNMLNSLDFEVVYNFLNAGWEKVFGPSRPGIRKKIIFENPLLGPAKEKLALDMEIFRNRVDVEKGSVDCRKCGSEETISVERQVRASDEPVSIFCRCLQCSYAWRAQ